MADSLYSSSWYRVKDLRPRVRGHAQIHRHDYRDQVWYILQDPSSTQQHRFSPAAHHLIGLMDGQRTIQEIWEIAGRQLDDHAPSQEEVITFLGQLHAANVLQCDDITPDGDELFRRHQKHRGMKLKQRLMTPLAMRFPLLDPDRWLSKTLPLARPVFGWFGALIWIAVVGAGMVLASMHWTDLTEGAVDRIFTGQNLLLLWLTYPVVKTIHEFGHAYATKVWGGEVHEMGIMLLVLMPIPYVEASAASAFREKHRRMVVAAAGILVELFLAALGLLVWLAVEPGIVRAVAFNVMLICSVSTLFFNGNPLLRFDGYYILADAVEIPNLATRSKKYLGYLFQRYLFGINDAKSPATAGGERGWFVFYGLASFAYRMFIMFVIILFIAGELFFIGVLLAIWAVVTQIVLPLFKSVDFVLTNPKIQRKRARAVLTSGAGLALVFVALFLLPAPLWTRAEGVVWLPERSQVRAGSAGFVTRLLIPEGSEVRRGDALVESEAPFLDTRVKLLEARLRELGAQLNEVQFSDLTRAEVVRKEMESVSADLARARELRDALTVYSPVDGRFVVPNAHDLPGRFLQRGDLIGYVVEPSVLTIRAAVGQADIGLVRERTQAVEAVLDTWEAAPMPAAIQREVPGATDQLPSAALGTSGGGQFFVNPQDPGGLQALDKVFQFELVVPEEQSLGFIGARVQVRFDHGAEPLAYRWYRSLTQLFLTRFGV